MNWILAAISIHQRKSKETVVWVEKWNGEKKQSDIRRKKKENQQSSRYSSMESVGQVSWNVFHISSVASISHIAPDHQYTVVVYTEDNRKRQKEKNKKKKKEENKNNKTTTNRTTSRQKMQFQQEKEINQNRKTQVRFSGFEFFLPAVANYWNVGRAIRLPDQQIRARNAWSPKLSLCRLAAIFASNQCNKIRYWSPSK